MSMSAEMLSQPPSSSVADVEPGRIKVFGIIHIIFGGLGLVGSAFGVVALLALNPVLSWMEEMIRQDSPPGDVAGEEVVAVLESFGAMRTLLNDLALLNWVSSVTGLAVAVLILWAGIRLVKRRKDAVRCSNIYTWASIVKGLLHIGLYLVTGSSKASRGEWCPDAGGNEPDAVPGGDRDGEHGDRRSFGADLSDPGLRHAQQNAGEGFSCAQRNLARFPPGLREGETIRRMRRVGRPTGLEPATT